MLLEMESEIVTRALGPRFRPTEPTLTAVRATPHAPLAWLSILSGAAVFTMYDNRKFTTTSEFVQWR